MCPKRTRGVLFKLSLQPSSSFRTQKNCSSSFRNRSPVHIDFYNKMTRFSENNCRVLFFKKTITYSQRAFGNNYLFAGAKTDPKWEEDLVRRDGRQRIECHVVYMAQHEMRPIQLCFATRCKPFMHMFNMPCLPP